MTSNNRNKDFARRLQNATGSSYATCRQQTERWDAESFDGSGDETVGSVADQEVLAAVKAAAVGFPLMVGFESLAMGAPVVIVRHEDATGPGDAFIEIGQLDGFIGYTWRTTDQDLHAMADFLTADARLTPDLLARDTVAGLAAAREACAWLVGQFAAHPARYDDTGRPASVGEPIFV